MSIPSTSPSRETLESVLRILERHALERAYCVETRRAIERTINALWSMR